MYAVYQVGMRCYCCSWETLGVFKTKKDAKRFVGKDKTMVIVEEE